MAAAIGDLRQAGAHRSVDTEQVDLDDALEHVFVDREDRAGRRRDARVGDHDVEPAELLCCLVDRARDPSTIRHVSGQSERAIAADRGSSGLGGLLVEVDEHDGGASLVQRTRGFQADSPRRAGDQRDLAAHVVAGHERTLTRLGRC